MDNYASMEFINFLFRWGHLLFGIAWIGLLYYFNFVQGGYFKQATPEALSDAKAKLAPSALWWFRWGAMFTFITGVVLLLGVQKQGVMNEYIVVGALFGTLMFLNVWLIIWPNQKIALGVMPQQQAPKPCWPPEPIRCFPPPWPTACWLPPIWVMTRAIYSASMAVALV